MEEYEYNPDYYNYMAQNSAAILAEQKKTNQELQQLRSQMAHANAMQQQMLQNQINDIEERETQKFYKLRSFKLNQLVTSIDNLSDINQKVFSYYVFKDTIIQNATDAQNHLNEISDKEYCNTIISKTRDMYKLISNMDDLSIADDLKKFVNSNIEYYNRLCNELENAKTSLKNMPPPPTEPSSKTYPSTGQQVIGLILCGLGSGVCSVNFGIGILILVIGIVLIFTAKQKTTITDEEINSYKEACNNHQMAIDNLNSKIADIEDKIVHCDYMISLKHCFTNYPTWKTEIDECYKQLSY